MTKDSKQDHETSNEKSEKVGYCKPPKATRFRSGKSGNPSGRKKAPLSVADQIAKALNKKVTVTENGKRCRRTKQDIMLTSIANNAAKGDIRSAKFLMEIQNSHQDTKIDLIDASLLGNDANEIIDTFLKHRLMGQEEGVTDNFETPVPPNESTGSTQQENPLSKKTPEEES
ncbi:MAG: hypothetical protein JKY51_04850 [Opitutaceae bacterium]|nr:hypothetical protein [Opitutaceae bacterium]